MKLVEVFDLSDDIRDARKTDDHDIADEYQQKMNVQRRRFSKPRRSVPRMKQYLNVPYEDRQLAKEQGLRWDPEAKKWYAVVTPNTRFHSKEAEERGWL